MLQALMEATHSPEELAKFHAELEAEQGVKPLDTSSVRALAASIREQAASIRELAAVLRRPRVRTGTVETPSGPVTMTIRESRDG